MSYNNVGHLITSTNITLQHFATLHQTTLHHTSLACKFPVLAQGRMTWAPHGSLQLRLCVGKATRQSAEAGGKKGVFVASNVIGGTKYDRWRMFRLQPGRNAIDSVRYISRKATRQRLKGHG